MAETNWKWGSAMGSGSSQICIKLLPGQSVSPAPHPSTTGQREQGKENVCATSGLGTHGDIAIRTHELSSAVPAYTALGHASARSPCSSCPSPGPVPHQSPSIRAHSGSGSLAQALAKGEGRKGPCACSEVKSPRALRFLFLQLSSLLTPINIHNAKSIGTCLPDSQTFLLWSGLITRDN